MDIIHLNHAKILSGVLHKKPEDINVVAPTTSESASAQNATSPSTIVTLSDDAVHLQIMEMYKSAPQTTYIEKSDAEYAAMSYEQLIDERNGEMTGPRQPGDNTLKIMHFYGKADIAAAAKLREQELENSASSRNLQAALEGFKVAVAQKYPTLKAGFDIGFENGKAIIVSNSLDEKSIANIQSMLDDKANSKAVGLKNAVNEFNETGLKMINMLIYEEKYRFGGTNELGKKVIHRDDPLTLVEFTKNISYTQAVSSNSSYAWAKHADVIGSTSYGVKSVYEK